MRIGSVAQHQGTSTSYSLYAAGCCGVTPIPTGDYEGNFVLGIAPSRTAGSSPGAPARFGMTSILLSVLVLIFLVLILKRDGMDELRKIHVLSSGGLLFSSSNLEK
jgi:hypothetical protein